MNLTRRKLIVLAVAVAAVVVYVVVDVLRVTDEEKLHRLASRLEKCVEAHDAEGCVALADEESWDWLGTREQLMEILRLLFETYDPEDVRVRRELVEAQPPGGTVYVDTVVLLGSRSPYPGPVRNTWVLACIKKRGEWFISRAHIELEDGSVQSIPGLVGRERLPRSMEP